MYQPIRADARPRQAAVQGCALNVIMGNLTACGDVVIWAIDLMRGMELGPWDSCIARLATTPAQARVLMADGSPCSGVSRRRAPAKPSELVVAILPAI